MKKVFNGKGPEPARIPPPPTTATHRQSTKLLLLRWGQSSLRRNLSPRRSPEQTKLVRSSSERFRQTEQNETMTYQPCLRTTPPTLPRGSHASPFPFMLFSTPFLFKGATA